MNKRMTAIRDSGSLSTKEGFHSSLTRISGNWTWILGKTFTADWQRKFGIRNC